MERTEEQMRAYLKEYQDMHLWRGAELEWMAESSDEEAKKAHLEAAQAHRDSVLDEEAEDAYIAEHLEPCPTCGASREWHNHHRADHNFGMTHEETYSPEVFESFIPE